MPILPSSATASRPRSLPKLPRRTQIIGHTGYPLPVTGGTLWCQRRQRRFPHRWRRPDKHRLVTAAARLQTSSPICASTRLGVRLRSVVLRIRSMPHTTSTPPVTLALIPEGSGHPDDKWGWAVSGGLRLNAPMVGRRRLLPGPGQLHPRCAAVHLPEPEQQLVRSERSMTLPTASCRMASMAAHWARWDCNRHQADHGLGRQRVV